MEEILQQVVEDINRVCLVVEVVEKVRQEVRREVRREVVEVVREVWEVVDEVVGRCWRSSSSRRMSNGRWV